MGQAIMDNNESKDRDHVVFSSAWIGNVVLILVVVLVIAGAWAYKEYF
jgi:hypothetical protein